MTVITGVHPYADKFPMLPEGELAELAESIDSNGLRQPVVITPDGLILDGRNRVAACGLVGVDPALVVYRGDDLAEYVIDCNTSRRHMSTGARAMATAMVLIEDNPDRREGGRWKRGSVPSNIESNIRGQSWRDRLKEAGLILDFKPDLASAVVNGTLALDAAYQEAVSVRDSADRDRIMEREMQRRLKLEAQAEAEKNARIVADLTQAGATDLLADIDSGRFDPATAWAAHLEATRKERKRQEELERGWRDTCKRISQCVYYLDGGDDYAQSFLKNFYPHEADLIHPRMQLTRARIDSAIEFLNSVKEGVTQ